MSNKNKASELKNKILKTRELYSYIGEKPQGLEWHEIRDRVKGFLLNQSNLRDSFAFGEGVAIGNTEKDSAQFDPVESYKKDPSRIDEIMILVNHDMHYREAELINEAEEFRGSYNTLLFGVASKLAHDHKLSDTLKGFLLEHLIRPPENKKRAREDRELLSNLVFEVFWSCGDLVLVCGFNSVFEGDASDDFGEVVKAA